jgi:hypothetical protein
MTDQLLALRIRAERAEKLLRDRADEEQHSVSVAYTRPIVCVYRYLVFLRAPHAIYP